MTFIEGIYECIKVKKNYQIQTNFEPFELIVYIRNLESEFLHDYTSAKKSYMIDTVKCA